MDHKAWLASVPIERRQELTERRDLPGLIHLAGHLGALVLIAVLIALGIPFWPVLLLPQAILLACLFHLEHEATHSTPFKTAWLNRFAGHLTGFLLILPFQWFTAFHMAHHKWTNIAGKDPELATARPNTRVGWLWYLSGVPHWYRSITLLFRLVLGIERADYLSVRMQQRAEAEARIMLLGYLALFALVPIFPAIIWIWLVPLLIGQPFLRVYLLAEHGDLPQVSNMFDNTRTTISNRLVRRLTWNMPYHTEHHVWPSVPFHQLPKLHGDMQQQLLHTADGYIAFSKSYLDRRLHVSQSAATPASVNKETNP